MNEQVALVHDGQRPVAQPVEQHAAVGRRKDLVERVGFRRFLRAAGDGQQVQVVVTQYGVDAPGAVLREACHLSERCQRLRTAVDQVADEDNSGVPGGVFGNPVEQNLRFVRAALQVAYDVGFHAVTE